VPLEAPFDVTGEADVVAVRMHVAAEDVDEALAATATRKAGTMPGCDGSCGTSQVGGVIIVDSAIRWPVVDRRKCSPPSRRSRLTPDSGAASARQPSSVCGSLYPAREASPAEAHPKGEQRLAGRQGVPEGVFAKVNGANRFAPNAARDNDFSLCRGSPRLAPFRRSLRLLRIE
jgi:hypothetical protein